MTQPTTLAALRRTAIATLSAAGADTPALDARLLLEHALSLPAAGSVTRATVVVSEEDAVRAMALVGRRAAGEPVSRIVGHRGFWTLDLALNAATLDPRPDTETVVEAALAALPAPAAPVRILDLGTGTGCILLALLAERPNATGVGVDLSADAALAAAANAVRNGLSDRARFLTGSWGDGLAGSFDLVVSNPPYIPTAAIAGLDREVRDHDPRAALDGGADGLDAYRAIAAQLPRLLAPGGVAVLEAGFGQADDVGRLLSAGGLRIRGTKKDLGGIERAIIAENRC